MRHAFRLTGDGDLARLVILRRGLRETVEMYWYTLYTRSRHEKRVAQRLRTMGVDAFLPLAKVMSRWKDRRKLVHKPLFPSYLFFRSDEQKLFDIAQARGVVRILGAGFTKPTTVDEPIISSLKRLVTSGLIVERCPALKPGERARVIRGPLKGLEGILVATKRRLRLVIWVRFINSGAAVEVGSEDIEPV